MTDDFLLQGDIEIREDLQLLFSTKCEIGLHRCIIGQWIEYLRYFRRVYRHFLFTSIEPQQTKQALEISFQQFLPDVFKIYHCNRNF